ncbi:MAG: FadR/GntR family transcriptional regulator [Alkalispirochaeta sp.]
MEGGSDRITRISVTDEIARRIREMIESGAYSVGDKLPTEMELRDQFGVGRSSVREALRILQAYGLVELRPGTGAFVASVSERSEESIRTWFIEKETELDEMMEVRMAVEPLAVRLAIEKASDAELQEIVAIHEKFTKAVENADPLELATLDEAFHTAIISASHNSLLIKINRLLVEAFREYRTKAFGIPENIVDALGPHETIVAGLQEKNRAKGEKGMQEHLRVSLEDIGKVAHF